MLEPTHVPRRHCNFGDEFWGLLKILKPNKLDMLSHQKLLLRFCLEPNFWLERWHLSLKCGSLNSVRVIFGVVKTQTIRQENMLNILLISELISKNNFQRRAQRMLIEVRGGCTQWASWGKTKGKKFDMRHTRREQNMDDTNLVWGRHAPGPL